MTLKVARRARLWLGTVLLLMTALIPAQVSQAASGDILRTITVTPAPSCSVTVGVAFDGTELLVSCTANNEITRVSPVDGANKGAYVVTGLPASEGIGAMSWDAKNRLLWAGTATIQPMKVYSIALNTATSTATATYRFSHTLGGIALVDGLAYDGNDDTIWFSPDVDRTMYHYSLTGQLLGSFPVTMGNCGISGVAVASASTLYLANNGCGEIYAASKDGTTNAFFATLSGKRVEDLECDNTTFNGTSVLWSKDAYDYELNAFEVPLGECAEGGVLTADEEAFRAALQAQASNFPIKKLQKLGFFGIGSKGAAYGGLNYLLSNECLNIEAHPTEAELQAICAAAKLSGSETIIEAYKVAVEESIKAGLGGVDTYSRGGKVLVGAMRAFVDAAFDDYPTDSLIRSAATDLLAAMYGNFTEKYLADAGAGLTVDRLLKDDKPVIGQSAGTVKTEWGQFVQAKMQFIYNPYTHYVVAFLSSELDPNTVVVVYYEVGQDGYKLPNTQATFRVYSQ